MDIYSHITRIKDILMGIRKNDLLGVVMADIKGPAFKTYSALRL